MSAMQRSHAELEEATDSLCDEVERLKEGLRELSEAAQGSHEYSAHPGVCRTCDDLIDAVENATKLLEQK